MNTRSNLLFSLTPTRLSPSKYLQALGSLAVTFGLQTLAMAETVTLNNPSVIEWGLLPPDGYIQH